MQVRAYLVALRAHAVVHIAVAIGCAELIVKSKDSNLLAPNGGHISLSLSTGTSIFVFIWALSNVE